MTKDATIPLVFNYQTTAYTTQKIITSSRRPRLIPTRPPARPVLDGLAWLWRTWQETAPSPRRPSRQQQTNVGRPKTTVRTRNNAGNIADDGLDSDVISV